MVSKQALARKKAFLKEKENYKDAHDLQKALLKREYIVWWNDDGDIVGFTQEPDQYKKQIKKHNSATFSSEQVEIIRNNGSHGYCVKTDPEVDTVHYIQLKQEESTFVTHEKHNLSLIEDNVKRADITVSLKGKEFTIKCSKTVLNKYKNKNLSSATASGSRLLKFYFTAENDPSFLMHNTNITLPDLLEKQEVTRLLPTDMGQCSIYTIKIFDKYVRT